MPDPNGRVTAGVDAHTDTHTAAVLDAQGRLLGTQAFATNAAGYRALLGWLRSHGEIDRVGVESTGSYAAALVRVLHDAGLTVIEVNQPHPHARQRRGKNDAIDAELAARAAQSGTARAIPKQTDGRVEAIRQLTVARDGAIKARVAALGQLEDLLITAPEALRTRLDARKTLIAKAKICAQLRPNPGALADPLEAARFALRALARRIAQLDAEITSIDKHLTPLVTAVAPRTLALLGVGVQHTARLLIPAGENIDRLHSEAAFARICAAAPIPASSGRTTRHRLDFGGDRQANRALHMIVVCRLRHDPRSRAYRDRRLTEGRTKREIIRCLKRYVAREVFATLRADLTALHAT